jgi:hypothetical protein
VRRAVEITTKASSAVGGPVDVALEVGKTVITPIAEQVAAAAGPMAAVEFYTALTSYLVTSMTIVLGADASKKITAIAVGQIDEAAAGAAAILRKGAH